MVKKTVLIFIAITSFVLLDTFARFLYSQSWFSSTTFSNELDPFDILTLIVSSLVTIWLGWYVSKKVTEQRYKKEYVINDLKQIEEEINFIEKNMQSADVDLNSQLTLLLKLRTYIQRFTKTIDIFKISNMNLVDLEDCYNKIYTKTTNVEGDKLVMNEIVKNEINQLCSDFIIETRKLICKINNH